MLPLGVLGHLIAHRPIAVCVCQPCVANPRAGTNLGGARLLAAGLCALRAQSLQVAELTLGNAVSGHRAIR